jgi:hypothetical protein
MNIKLRSNEILSSKFLFLTFNTNQIKTAFNIDSLIIKLLEKILLQKYRLLPHKLQSNLKILVQ